MNANLTLCHRVVTHPKPEPQSQNPKLSETKTTQIPNPPNPKLFKSQIPKPKTIPKSQNPRPKCFG